MLTTSFVLGVLAHSLPKLGSEAQQLAREVRRCFPKPLTCYSGKRLSRGSSFWGADELEKPQFIAYVVGSRTSRKVQKQGFAHDALGRVQGFPQSWTGSVGEFSADSLMQLQGVRAEWLARSNERSPELYLFDYSLENTRGENEQAPWVDPLKRVLELVAENREVLRVDAAWSDRQIRVGIVLCVFPRESERNLLASQFTFIGWYQGLKHACRFRPPLWTEGVACGHGPEALTLVEGLQELSSRPVPVAVPS